MSILKLPIYELDSFHGVRNNDFSRVICKDKFVVLLKLQRYAVTLYHMYILNTILYQTKSTIHQYIYYNNQRKYVRKEASSCDTDQCTKQSTIKYNTFPVKLSEEIPWNKFCVYLIGAHILCSTLNKKHSMIKSIMVIDPVMQWF